MANNALQLLKAKKEDIPEIVRLADIVWHQHYPSIISVEQISYMLGMMYSTESLNEQMNIERHEFYFIRKENKNIGFIAISKIRNEPKGYFIHKFYLDQTLSGKGNGTEAHNELVKLLQPTLMRLTVNRQNFKSINFYFKNGFKIESVADFDIGNGYVMNDFVMIWKK